MENKSRVIKYESLRKKISNMDSYSFEETPEVVENIPEVKDTFSQKNKSSSSGVKKNTLSLSLDELMKENASYHEQKENIESKKIYKKKEKERKKKEKERFTVKLWMLFVPIILVLCVVFFFLIKGAI